MTLPVELREKYGIEEGDTFRLVDLDGVFVPTRMVNLVPELAQEIERLRLEAGLTTEELLDGLREQRERCHARPMRKRRRPRVFVDTGVILAGSASPSEHSASLVTLRMGAITLIDAVTSCHAITEAEGNLAEKIPDALTTSASS